MGGDKHAATRERWRSVEGLRQIREWVKDGLRSEQIAEQCGAKATTLWRWRSRYPEIEKAMNPREGDPPQGPDEEVENALLSKCRGYTVSLKKTYKLKRVEYGENGRKLREWEELRTGVDEAHVPADTGAQKFWLANRRKGSWRDKPEAHAGEETLKKAGELLGGVDSGI